MKEIPHNFVTRYGHKYYATEDGHIYSGHLKRTISEFCDKNGYKRIRLSNGDGSRRVFSVHRLVLQTFKPIENYGDYQVNHIDGNKTNNNISNLEWVTCAQNVHHAIEIGLRNNTGGNNTGAKLTVEQVKEIIDLLLSKQYLIQTIADMYNVHKGTIERIKYKKTWKSLTQNINFN